MYRRTQWRQLLQPILIFLPAILLLDLFLVLRNYRTLQQNLLAQIILSHEHLPSAVQQQRSFITAQFWSSETLLTTHWIDGLLRLIHLFDPKDVYVSLLSNHGLDNTEVALCHLDAQLAQLGVPRTIILDPTTHEDAVSVEPEDSSGSLRPEWAFTHDGTRSPGTKQRRRIPYLSNLRNRALEPLQHLQRTSNLTFDRILYLNDVIFKPSDVLTLLATNGGEFDVACGLDYHHAPYLYDNFAARDISIRGPITSVFPYFGAPKTRDAMLAGLPAPATSCWNGVVAADAAPYRDKPVSSQDPPNQAVQKSLRFRALPDSLATYYLEASECCLIHADLLASGRLHKGMFMNPAVRTAYVVKETYDATHFGAYGSNFVSAWQYVSGIWIIRWRRWVWSWIVDAVSVSAGQNMREVNRMVGLWEQESNGLQSTNKEVGLYCTISQMQILVWNGWKYIQNDLGKMKMRGLRRK